jgi:serine/threonine protein kinase
MEAEYQAGSVIANKYVIESVLGSSDSGRTYLGNENYSEEKVCIKLYDPQVSSECFSGPDFFLQAGKAATVRHENICRSYEINEEIGRVYFVREYVKGSNFKEWMGREETNPNFIKKGIEIVWQACQALGKLHEMGKHLNIHPGNIIVGELGVKITDWDLRAISGMDIVKYLPVHSLFKGYRAPEIREHGALAFPSSDLFSAGGLLYRLILGQDPPESPDMLLNSLGAAEAEAREFLSKALSPDPQKRFQEAESFSSALWELSEVLSAKKPRKSADSAFQSGFSGPEPLPPNRAAFADDGPATGAEASPASEEPVSFVPKQKSDLPAFPREQPQSPPLMEQPGTPLPGKKKFSLEEKNYDDAGSSLEPAGYTMYGFKGLKPDQTGVVRPESKDKKRRTLLFVVIGGLAAAFVLLAALVIHQVVSGGAEEEPDPVSLPSGMDPENQPAEIPDNDYPEEPVEEMHEEKAPVQPEGPELRAGQKEEGQKEKDVKVYRGNEKVSAAREKEIMNMYHNEQWPADAGSCLNMGDDMNDLGRTMEANLCYQHAMTYTEISQKQKVHALGGLGVTYNKLNQKEEARKSLEQLLKIDPENRFALSYIKKL